MLDIVDTNTDRRVPYEKMAKLGRALASPQRLQLLNLLAQSECAVEALAQGLGESVATASHHLQRLLAAQLVAARKSGRHVVYSLADPEVAAFWLSYRDFCGRHLPELQVWAASLEAHRQSAGVMDRETLRRHLKGGRAVVLDVRPQREYDAGHIAGAICIPLDELAQRIAEVPRHKTIVLCCRGPYCLLAEQAQKLLLEHGIQALQLSDGAVEWAAAGLPVKRGGNSRQGSQSSPSPKGKRGVARNTTRNRMAANPRK